MSTPAYIQSLLDARAGFAAKIEAAATDNSAPGGKPNNGSEGGGTDHMGALNTWLAALREIDEQLQRLGYDSNGNKIGFESIAEGFA
ncbi:hypothetical protein [Rubinisphaera brasiliensis]|uniref:Uncharacterized protein n=1 Tax=Rubinisphaera brasiliensis (strain ATCC 49424 / DSM 5305 / JCM 21570 / IAM 15109 / NBRC 103401 / IFAM 1448) TaxID=756272 RepID=F0SNM0_RUBBR|nr:hypothetical protein [Rubinisphaera brasiliensis]ADY57854.1 hypothetical protein Plabr_0225 [Rubinisphaera brasiliensis DSM 5305]